MPVLDREAMPLRIRLLPVDERGYPVPWFVATIDGKPDFRVIAPGRIRAAIVNSACWVCGGIRNIQAPAAFVIGPMCAVNRVTAEPPSHPECAIYSATHCPFLTIPKMHRRESRMPEGAKVPAGISIRRNPGVALVWLARPGSWQPWRDPQGGMLFHVGEPVELLWFAEGRPATRAEVEASIQSGLPTLLEMAIEDGPAAVAELERMVVDAMPLLPQPGPAVALPLDVTSAGAEASMSRLAGH